MKALILAGGLGTRLRSRVPDLPKVLAPVGDRPFLEYVLDGLVAGGIEEIVLSVGYRRDEIIKHFGKSYKGAVLSYSVEDEPLGTGGAILQALTGQPDEPILVLNGDTLVKIDYQDLFRWYATEPESIAMVLLNVMDVARYGSVRTSGGRVVGYEEKGTSGPGLINAGIYIARPGLFSGFNLARRFSFEVDFLQRYCPSLRPLAYLAATYFIDIGIPEDFDRAQRELPQK